MIKEAHGVTHCSKKQTLTNLNHWWHPYLKHMVSQYISDCSICNQHNTKKTMRPPMSTFPVPTGPGQEIVIDYTDMGPDQRINGYRYLLVVTDSFSKWVEAIPTKKEDSQTVCKYLINQYVPRFGLPLRIRSDNGTHFKNTDLQAVEKALGISHAFGSVYHPQAQGQVERMNQTIKTKLAKACADSKLKWTEALPFVLMSIRNSVNRTTGYTPYELMTGRGMPGPATAGPLPSLLDLDNLNAASHYYALTTLVAFFSLQVKQQAKRKEPARPPPTKVKDGDWVWLKVIKRKWAEARWSGPYQVKASTSHSVKLAKKGDNWYHLNQCAPATPPERSLDQTRTDLEETGNDSREGELEHTT